MTILLWLIFLVVIGTLIVIDLGLVTRRPRVVTPVEALASFSLWVLSAVGFSLLVWYVYEKNWLNLEATLAEVLGPVKKDLDGEAAWVQWITCYVVEMALSLDNIAIAALLLRYFKIPRPLVSRTLFWSTLVSLIVRLVLILASAWLLRSFEWVKWAFCAVLMLAMLRTLLAPDETTEFDRKLAVRAIRRFIPISPTHHGQRLFVRVEGDLGITPIMLVVLVLCVADLTFALDSAPALFSVTRDPFLAFSASAFALLALRSLYFALTGVLGRFRYLRVSLVFILLCVACKMFLVSRHEAFFELHATLITLAIVAGIMAMGVGASAVRYRMKGGAPETAEAARPSPLEDLSEAVEVSRRNFRKVVILIVGSAIVLIAAPLVGLLPGPGGIFVAAAGLAVLATEFVWAKRLLNKVKDQGRAMAERADKVASRTSPWLVAPVVIVFVGAVFALAHYVFTRHTSLVYLVSIGPAIAIGYWAYKTIITARQSRSEHVAAAQMTPRSVANQETERPPAA